MILRNARCNDKDTLCTTDLKLLTYVTLNNTVPTSQKTRRLHYKD